MKILFVLLSVVMVGCASTSGNKKCPCQDKCPESCAPAKEMSCSG